MHLFKLSLLIVELLSKRISVSTDRRERSCSVYRQVTSPPFPNISAYNPLDLNHVPDKTKLLRIMPSTLFSPLQLQEEGLRTFTAYLRGQVSATAKENFEALVVAMDRPVVKGAGPDFVGVLTELFKVGRCL
jgi:hypothetical protein